MHKFRVPIFIITIAGVLFITWILIQIGNGYRPNIEKRTIDITGLLVTNSEPKGAQVFINGEIKTATDDTLNLSPGSYKVELKKNGFFPWSKTLKIEAGLVTQTSTTLFPSTTDLKAITYTGVNHATLSPNGSRIVYAVTTESSNSSEIETEAGIWILELSDLPLRFNRDPQQVVKGLPQNIDINNLKFEWSYDSQEFLTIFYEASKNPKVITNKNTIDKQNNITLNMPPFAYKFKINDTNASFTSKYIINNPQTLINNWKTQSKIRQSDQLSQLHIELNSLLSTASSQMYISPDETKIIYTATSSSQLAEKYITEVLSSSTQPQTRILTKGHTYIYDIKEDKNFDISESLNKFSNPQFTWFPTSRHIIISTLEGVHLLEYDNTNLTTIYSGPLSNAVVFPHPSSNRIIIETSLNPIANPNPNLYAIIIK